MISLDIPREVTSLSIEIQTKRIFPTNKNIGISKLKRHLIYIHDIQSRRVSLFRYRIRLKYTFWVKKLCHESRINFLIRYDHRIWKYLNFSAFVAFNLSIFLNEPRILLRETLIYCTTNRCSRDASKSEKEKQSKRRSRSHKTIRPIFDAAMNAGEAATLRA